MLKLLKNFTKKDWLIVVISLLLIIFQVWLDLKLPDYMSEITKLVQTEGSQMSDVLKQGGYMLACAFGSLIAAIVVGYLTSLLSASFTLHVRKKLFENVENFGMQEIKKFSTSSLITRTTNDITNVQMLISMGLQLLIKSPITAVWAVIKILNKNWQWSALTGVAVLVLMSCVSLLVALVLPRFKKVQKMIDNINELTRENLTGIRVVRAFNAEGYQEDKFEVGNTELTNTQMFNQRAMSAMSPVIYLVMNTLTLSIYFVGSRLIDSASMMDKLPLFADMVVFSSYAMQVIMSFLMLSMIFIMYPRAQVSAQRIAEVLDTKPSIKDGKVNSNETDKKGEIEFKNVSFKYPDGDDYVLKNISFTAHQGETVAIIGSTGSGKTTMINLIPRFYDATEGTILVDGVDVKDYNQEFLHNKLGYVPQKAVMFSGSVNYNVAYGDNGKGEISEDTIKKSVEIAQAEEFVEKMPEKYEAHVAQGGTNLSGGQKQRLAIARAIARNPEIYIFDDSFSALDYKTDYTLREELRNYTKDSTNIIVAQRIGTILNADKIIVLENGECVGMGTHKELLSNCKVYQEIAYSQLSKEELENG